MYIKICITHVKSHLEIATLYIIKLFFSLFVLQKGTLKVRFLLKAMVLRLHDGKRPRNLWQVLSLISLDWRSVSDWHHW